MGKQLSTPLTRCSYQIPYRVAYLVQTFTHNYTGYFKENLQSTRKIFSLHFSLLTTRFLKFWLREIFQGLQNHELESLRKCKFGPLYFSLKWTKVVDSNSLKVDQRRFLDQSRICEVSPTRDFERLQILFWTQINDKGK